MGLTPEVVNFSFSSVDKSNSFRTYPTEMSGLLGTLGGGSCSSSEKKSCFLLGNF